MKLISTRKVFHFEDASGYAFDVVAEDTGHGWTASVTMRAGVYVTAEHAVRCVGRSAEEFLRQLQAAEDGAP